jgi:hypothetical protein
MKNHVRTCYKKFVQLTSKFRNDCDAIIIPLTVGVVLIIATALLWLVSMYPVNLIWDSLSPMMPDSATHIMTMLNNVCGWALLVEVVGLLIWMGIHTFRKEVVDVPF